MANKTVTFTAGMLLVWIIGSLLYVGRGFLIPIVIAVFIWYLLNTVNVFVKKIPKLGDKLPQAFIWFFSVGLLFFCCKIIADIVTDNLTQVLAASPRYQDNLLHMLGQIDAYFHIKILSNLNAVLKEISLRTIAVTVYNMFTTIASSAFWIMLYLLFLFVEQHYFAQKMEALFTQSKTRLLVNNILAHIVQDTQAYLGLKTILSLVTAGLSFGLMKTVQLDFAAFWALLIFFLNFIPSIGPIIATLFPALLALVQFTTWAPFMVISLGITAIQFIVGNIIEPRFLSKSLNLSPLVILFALSLWSGLWGIWGMFLSVPMTVMMMIIFAHFEKTRPIAILLSQDGRIQKTYANLRAGDYRV